MPPRSALRRSRFPPAVDNAGKAGSPRPRGVNQPRGRGVRAKRRLSSPHRRNGTCSIHCCTALPDAGNAGVATTTPTFTNFPLGVTSGSYDFTYDLTAAGTYNPAFVTAEGSVAIAEAALLGGIAAGDSYLN